jgi:tripartite-type tricarboxylate transporter receptor subunit TctC
MTETKLPRRTFLHLAVGAAALPAISRIARAQSYPTRAVRLIVPFAAGGGQDAAARLLANRLSEIWRQQVVVENRGGGGGNIGNQAAAQSPPDGYTILFGSPSLAISPHMYASLGYNPMTDLAPVTFIGSIPNVMAVPKDSPAKSVREFIDLANRNRGKLTFGSSGVGASPHLSGELLKTMAKIEILHVPYRGIALAFNDLLAGRIDAFFGNMPTILPHVRSGAIRALAVTSTMRSPTAPEIPTFAEAGVPGYEVTAWSALFAPAKTPAEFISNVRDATIEALSHPPVKQKFEEIGFEIATSTPQQLAAYLKAETEKWGPIIKAAGIKPA